MPQHCCRKSDIDPRAVVEAMLDAWTRRDLEETLGYFSDDVGYNIDLTAAEVPFAGASHGKTQLREQLQRILDIFITVLRAPEIYRVSGNRVYARNHVYYLHRSSRQFYELHYRTSYVVENGLIIKGTSHYDRAKLAAFLALFSSPASVDGANARRDKRQAR